MSLEFDEVIDKDLFHFRISKITKEFAFIIFEIPVSKYNFKIEEKIKKFTSIKLMEFIGLNSNLKSVNYINNKNNILIWKIKKRKILLIFYCLDL